jgi:Arc/MetJ-type ribon-helix-helix transcriptional regulator
MKTLTVRLPEPLVAEIESESRGRGISKSDVVRERLQRARVSTRPLQRSLEAIADLIGSVDGLPVDLSANVKHYLRATDYGRKRTR